MNRQIGGNWFRLACGAALLASAAVAQAADASKIAKKTFPSVVVLVMQDAEGKTVSQASGFFVQPDLVATNLHVTRSAVAGHAKIVGDKTKHDVLGQVGMDRQNDLVLLKLKDAKAPALRLAKQAVEVGDTVFAVGNPQGLEGTFSDGLVSGVRKLKGRKLLQVTAPLSEGSSGGPVLNEAGRVVGVAVATAEGGQNLNFAIPAPALAALIEQAGPVRDLPGKREAERARRMIGSGDGFFTRDEYAFAAEEYAAFLARFPDHAEAPRARFQLGQCYSRLKEYEKAASPLEALARSGPPKLLRAKGLYLLGQCRWELKQYDKAAEAFARLVQEAPKHSLAPRALYWKGDALYNQKQYEAAAAAARTLIEDYPKNDEYVPKAWYLLGWARFETKDYRKAAAAFRTLVTKYPNDGEAGQAQLQVGECLFRTEQYAKALAAYRAVVDQFPGEWSDDALMGAGSCLFELKRPREAAETFAAVAETYPESKDAPLGLLNAAQSWLAGNEPEKALAVADRFEQKYAKSGVAPRMTAARGQALLARKKHGEAAKQFRRAIEAGLPKDERPVALFNLGDALYGAKKFEPALAAYRTVTKEYGTHRLAEEANYAIIYCHAKQDDLNEAVARCASFAKAYPKSHLLASVKSLEGEYRYRLKDYAGARDACLASLELDAKGERADDARYKLGWSYRKLGEHAKAGEQFLRLAREFAKSPYAAESLFWAGLSAADNGDTKAAVKHLEACETRFADSPFAARAAYRLALLAYNAGDFKAARPRFAHFLKTYPESDQVPRALAYAGETAFQLEDYQAARRLYRRQVDEHPKAGAEWAPIARYGLAWCDRRTDKPAKAAAAFKTMIAAHPKSEQVAESRFWLARSLEDAGEFAEALAAFRTFLDQHPDHELAAAAGYRVGTSLYGAGKHAEAAKQFEQFAAANPKSEFADNAAYNLAWCHKQLKNTDEAIAAYRKLLDDHPKSELRATALFELGNLLFEKESFADAARRYQAAADLEPGDLLDKVYYKLGLAHARQDQHAKAADAFRTLYTERPNSTYAGEARYRYARMLQQQGKTAEAIPAFQQALDAKPGDEFVELAMFQIGECHAAEKSWGKGIAAYRAAREKFPNSQMINEIRYGEGLCAEELGAYKDAVEAYQAVLDSGTPTVTAAKARYHLGLCRMNQKNYREAIKQFHLVDIHYGYDEWCAAALYMAGQSAEKMDDPERARRYYKKVAENKDYAATAYGPKAAAALEAIP
ncbi:MAG: tetratricopeptide repeat protein [Planctomycetota bacterium]